MIMLSPGIPAGGEGYWYLASPFTKYPDGHEAAWLEISRIRGELLNMGIYSYSPIAESWGAVKQLKLPTDHKFWSGDNLSKMRPATGIIIAMMDSWTESDGLKGEMEWFKKEQKPFVWLTPRVQTPMYSL